MSGGYYVIGDMKGNGEGFRGILSWLMERVGHNRDPRFFYVDAGGNMLRSCQDDFRTAIKRINRFAQVNTQKLSDHMGAIELAGIEDKLTRGFAHADIVFFEAGDIEILRRSFARFQLGAMAQSARDRGAFVGGLCGGGSILAQNLVFHENDETSFGAGEGLIAGVTISCKMNRHEQHDSRLALLSGSLGKQFTHQAIGIAADQAVLFDGNAIGSIPTGRDKDGQAFTLDPAFGKVPVPFIA